MARVAVVTGGTRGIGEAISVALKNAGYTVAANYAGNDDRARAFTERTGIKAFKWDVSSFEDCVAGVKTIREAGEIAIEKSPTSAAVTPSAADAVCTGRPALPVPVTVSAWLASAAPDVPTVSVQVGLAAVSGVVQPPNATSAGVEAPAIATDPVPNAAFGESVTV